MQSNVQVTIFYISVSPMGGDVSGLLNIVIWGAVRI